MWSLQFGGVLRNFSICSVFLLSILFYVVWTMEVIINYYGQGVVIK